MSLGAYLPFFLFKLQYNVNVSFFLFQKLFQSTEFARGERILYQSESSVSSSRPIVAFRHPFLHHAIILTYFPAYFRQGFQFSAKHPFQKHLRNYIKTLETKALKPEALDKEETFFFFLLGFA